MSLSQTPSPSVSHKERARRRAFTFGSKNQSPLWEIYTTEVRFTRKIIWESEG